MGVFSASLAEPGLLTGQWVYQVTCLNVAGNKAVVGGVLLVNHFGTPPGSPIQPHPEQEHVFVWFEDNGPSGSDETSFFFTVPDPDNYPDLPDPTVSCPSPVGPPNGEMFPVAGNITIRDV